jgi:hypothetical protein
MGRGVMKVDGIVMSEQSEFQVHASKYQTLARGYAALKSKLADPAKGAAKAYKRLADEAGKPARDRQSKQSPN